MAQSDNSVRFLRTAPPKRGNSWTSKFPVRPLFVAIQHESAICGELSQLTVRKSGSSVALSWTASGFILLKHSHYFQTPLMSEIC